MLQPASEGRQGEGTGPEALSLRAIRVGFYLSRSTAPSGNTACRVQTSHSEKDKEGFPHASNDVRVFVSMPGFGERASA